MSTARRDADSYRNELISRMPRGKIWPALDGDATNWNSLLDALANEPARINADASDLLFDELFPDTANLTLADWERAYGLTSYGLTDDDRRAQLLARYRRRGNPTLANVQSVADAFPLATAIVSHHDYTLFRMGISAMGDPLRSDAWLSTVLVKYDSVAYPPGDAFDAFAAAIRAAVPLHAYIVFEALP